MSANIKVKYKGSNPDFTFDKVYQVLAVVSPSSVQFVVMSDNNQFGVFSASSADIELVSVTYPGDIQLYP